jgi:hypothetical protein
MTGKRKPAGRSKTLPDQALNSQRSQAVKGGFLGNLIKKATRAVSTPVKQ